MAPKKTQTITQEKVTSLPQVNPVARRIQTEEGWKRSQMKMKLPKSKKS